MRESSSARPASGSTANGLRSRGGEGAGKGAAGVVGVARPLDRVLRHWSADAATAARFRAQRGFRARRALGLRRGFRLQRPRGVLAERDCARQRIGRRCRPPGSQWRSRAHDVLFDHDVGRSADDEEMLHIVAADEHEAAAVVDRRLIDHGKPRLATTRRRTAQPSAAEPAQQPEREREQAQHHHQEQQNFRTGLSFAEQGIQDHSSLRPRGVACRSGSPEWLTPLAISVAMNTNKELR